MSLKESFPTQVPMETARFVEPLLSEDNIYRFIGQHIDQIISDADFVAMYAEEGRPGVNPVILALVTIFQFLEKLPDLAAAQMAVLRLDWKYALRQSLDWTGFHYADLCNFRKRLLAHQAERTVFERVIAYLCEQGYVQAGGRKRTDSTHYKTFKSTLPTEAPFVQPVGLHPVLCLPNPTRAIWSLSTSSLANNARPVDSLGQSYVRTNPGGVTWE